MKCPVYIWLLMLVVAVIYIATLTFVRIKNPEKIQYEAYRRWQETHLVRKDSKQTYVSTSNDQKHSVAPSEGRGYGLRVVSHAAEKGWANENDFDKLLNYYLAHRDYVGKHHDQLTYLMSWRQSYNKEGRWGDDRNSVTDGDLYIAAALHRAAKVWPQKALYYHRLEQQTATDIVKYEYNPTTHMLTVGGWVTKDSKFYYLLRTSDVTPTVFDHLHDCTHDSRWQTIKNNMLDRLTVLSKQHRTGLVPDFAWVRPESIKPVGLNTVAGKYDGDYSVNACRVPVTLAKSNGPRAQKVLSKMMRFFSEQYYITAGYSLNGHRLVKYQSNSFSALIFYAVNCNRNEGYDNLFVNQKHIFSKPLTEKNYYDATLTILAVLEGMN